MFREQVWKRTLNSAEIYEIYSKGAFRVKAQVRACSDNTCSTNPSYIGPDNTTSTYFTNTSSLSTGLPNTTSFQYKLYFDLADSYRNDTAFIYNMTIAYSPISAIANL